MIEKETIKNLLELSRIDVNEQEQEKLSSQLGSIFEYIAHIHDIEIEGTDATKKPISNVVREDKDPHLAGEYSEDLMREIPEAENGYVKVPKIL